MNIKRTLLVLLVWPLLAAPEALQAQSGSDDGFDYSINTDNASNITITNYNGSSGDVVIPASINGLVVTCIGAAAFEFGGLTNVTIPNSVTSIDPDAFQQCGLLTSVIIPNSVTNIGAGAFLLCGRLTNLVIGTNVTSIGGGAFFDCPVPSVTIPNSVTSIGDEAFCYCDTMTTLVLGDGVTNIGNEAFEYCDSLETVTIPASVASIGSAAFGYCQFLFSVYILGNAPANDGSAFTNNSMVTVYYLSGTSGWSSAFGGRPTVSAFADLYTFFKVPDDGQHPYAALTLAGSRLYGTTGSGGSFGNGTLFAINLDGSGYTNFYSFGSNAHDGANPSAGLTLAGSRLFGTAVSGGSFGYGTIFAINTDGTGYTNLYSFGGVADDGIAPLAGLTLVGSTLYGTTQAGFGNAGDGTIFAINTDGSGYTNIYLFGTVADDGFMTGSSANLTLVGAKLYGTAPHGGIYGSSQYGYGTIFAINTDGSDYTNLYRFGGTANDGAVPFDGRLTLAGSTLYGTTYEGLGSSSDGTIFAINLDGTGYTNLYRFGSDANDGTYPQTGLTLAGSMLFGATYSGGGVGAGTIFAINTNGRDYTILASCAGLSPYGGAYPNGLTLVGSVLYGTTSCGGTTGYGTVFELTTNTVPMAIIAVQSSSTAGGTVSGSGGIYPVGTDVQITATANTGWTFSGWSDGGAQTHTITVPVGRTTYTAVFTPNSTNGCLLTTITPTAAVSAGAQWRVNGGAYQASGATLTNLAATNVTVSFKTIPGWITPPDQTALLTIGQTNALVGFYVENSNPSLSILSPKAGQIFSNSSLTVTGTAKDKVAVGPVYIQLDAGGWTLATPGNSWSNWTASVTLHPGLNSISAYAVNTSGNASSTNTVNLVKYISSAMLSVQTNGLGSITPVDNSKLLAIGSNYTLTASPAKNWLFSNWVASGSESFVSNNPVLKFTMQSNLVLTADFVTNLFLAAQGSYHGLFAPTGVVREETNSGAFVLNLLSTGAFTGDLFLGSNTVSLAGKFNVGGYVQTNSTVKGGRPLTTTLQLDVANQAISGMVSDGSFTAQLDGDQNVFGPAHPATEYAGQYTWTIPGTNNPLVGPYGTSYGTVTVNPNGDITFAGSLADGTTVSQSSAVSQDGRWPMFLPSSNPNESVYGWNYFTNQTLTAPASVSWISLTNKARSALYSSGFTNQEAALVASYYNPTAKPLLSLTGAQVTLQGGGLPFGITNQITLAANNTISVPTTAGNTNHLKLTITSKTGAITGSFQNPANARQTITINGVLLQNQTNAQGYFLGTNQSGTFLLEGQ